MATTPNNTMVSLVDTKARFQKNTYLQCIEDNFTINQFKEFFGNKESERAISQFKTNCMVLFSDRDAMKTMENADKFTVIQSLINLSKDNLSINPYDKEACIVNYGGKVTAMAMTKGKIKRMQEKGAIKYIDLLEVVFDCDKIENVNGKYSFSRNVNPPKEPKRLGVLMIVIMPDGRPRHKFVLTKDIELRRTNAPAKAIWDKWTDEMYRKTCINIFEKEIGVTTLLFSNEYEEEQQQEKQEEQHEEQGFTEYTEEEKEPEIIQDPIVRSQLEESIKNNPTILKSSEIDQLMAVIDGLDDAKLLAWIKAIETRKLKKQELQEQQLKDDAPVI